MLCQLLNKLYTAINSMDRRRPPAHQRPVDQSEPGARRGPANRRAWPPPEPSDIMRFFNLYSYFILGEALEILFSSHCTCFWGRIREIAVQVPRSKEISIKLRQNINLFTNVSSLHVLSDYSCLKLDSHNGYKHISHFRVNFQYDI